MKIIGLAGGSGAGKSTVSYALVDAQPDRFEVLNFDDYQKVGDSQDLPRIDGMINWDHPDAIRWNALIADLQSLKSGQPITLATWAHRSNPDYVHSRQKLSRTIEPKPWLIVEGYLALYNSEVNQLYDHSFYLDLASSVRHSRRDKDAVIGEAAYVEKVLKPMHQQYVEPTKRNADMVIDMTDQTVEQICKIILNSLD